MHDAHCHLYDETFNGHLKETLDKARKEGVKRFVCATTDSESIEKAIKICKANNDCLLMAGYFPCDVKYLESAVIFDNYLKLLKDSKDILKCIGEIGLDYYWEKDLSQRELQRKWFIKQILIADDFGIPVCIHCRDAIGDCLEILKLNTPKYGFYMHAYNGSIEITKELIKLGAYFSIGGVVTFKNAQNLRETIKIIPNNKILIETDSPYLTPVPFRGQKNEPSNVKYVLKEIAKIKEINEKELNKIVDGNFAKFFHVEIL